MSWKLLLVLILLCVPIVLGSSTRYLPDRCDFGHDILCEKEKFKLSIDEDDSFNFWATLTNKYDKDIVITAISAEEHLYYKVSTTTDKICLNEPGIFHCGPGSTEVINGSRIEWKRGTSKELVVIFKNTSIWESCTRGRIMFDYQWYTPVAGPKFAKTGMGEIYTHIMDKKCARKKFWKNIFKLPYFLLGLFLVLGLPIVMLIHMIDGKLNKGKNWLVYSLSVPIIFGYFLVYENLRIWIFVTDLFLIALFSLLFYKYHESNKFRLFMIIPIIGYGYLFAIAIAPYILVILLVLFGLHSYLISFLQNKNNGINWFILLSNIVSIMVISFILYVSAIF